MVAKSKKSTSSSSAGAKAQKMAQKSSAGTTKPNLKKLQISDPVNRNDRIMSALDKLGQKFIEGEADRLSMKKSVDDNFNAQRELDRKLKRQSVTSEKLEKSVNELLQENERLRQMVGKSDKRQLRLQKRIERVESIASEAQAALEAKAMVLLTDRSLANEVGLPQISANPNMDDLDADQVLRAQRAAGLRGEAYDDLDDQRPLLGGLFETPAQEQGRPWWQRRLQMSTSVVLGFVLIAGITGWGLSQLGSNYNANDMSFAIMQDGQLARVNLMTGEVTPVMLAAKEAVQEQMSRDMQFKLPSSAQDQEQAVTEGGVSADGTPVPAGAKPNASEAEDQNTAQSTEAENNIYPPVLPGDGKPLAERIEADPKLSGEIKELENRAFAGEAEAQHDLAALYTAGQGVTQDYNRAEMWFKEAATANISNASYNLGVLYHQGLGVEQDMATALDWYRRAALMGHPEAQYNLGIAYIEGIGAKYNPNLASAYFKQAALNGIVEGAYNLGLILENGLLGQAYLEQAMAWYRAAADKGNVQATQSLTALADKLGVDIDNAGLLGRDDISLAASMADLANIQPASGGEAAASMPNISVDFDLVLADYIPLWDQMVLTEIQGQLAALSLYTGAQDGVIGPATVEAIKTYQTIQGLEITGKPSQELAVFMLSKATIEDDAS